MMIVKSGRRTVVVVAAGLVALTACGAPAKQAALSSASPTASPTPSSRDNLSWDAQFKLIQIGDAAKTELGASFGGEEIDRAHARLVVHFSGDAAAFSSAQARLASKFGASIELVRAVQSEEAALKLEKTIAAAIQNSHLPVSQIAPLPNGAVRVWTSGDTAAVLALLVKNGIKVRNSAGLPVVDVVTQDVGVVSPDVGVVSPA